MPFLAPVYIYFEDPEYNRQLSSRTTNDEKKTANGRYFLAADRREYNPNGTLILATEVPEEAAANLKLKIDRVRDGVLLSLKTFENVGSQFITEPLSEYGLMPKDVLLLQLELDKEVFVRIQLPIVSAPVVPASKAMYALLRRDDAGHYSCVCAPWSLAAHSFELVYPPDLFGELVRRRAAFILQNTVRRGEKTSYAIQKVTALGSTHFPIEQDFVAPK